MFDRSGGHSPPSVWHLFPDSAGRSVRLFRFAFRLGQRGAAPFCARPLDEARRQVESSDGHVPPGRRRLAAPPHRRRASPWRRAGVQLQHLLDRVPFVTGEPAVDTRGRLLGTLFLLSGHAVLRVPGANRFGS